MADDTSDQLGDQLKRKRDLGDLLQYEIWWRDLQPWLQQNGYMLRPRLRPNWIPSWRGTKKSSMSCEDGQAGLTGHLIDATRVSDGKLVCLKKVSKSLHPSEATIARFFSSEPLLSDPKNHCVPVYEILQVPDEDDRIIIIMPFLREFNSPNFETIGEIVGLFSQALKGMQFIHQHRVAHRDATSMNLMFDGAPMYPEGFHPHIAYQDLRPSFKGKAKYCPRTQRPPKYYWIDFGLSCQYNSSSSPTLEDRMWGGDRSVPEFQGNEGPHDPFPTDVYYVGNLFKTEFVDVMYGLEFMEPLIADMTENDPTKRPTMDVVVSRFDEIRQSLSNCKLRSRAVKKKEPGIVGLYRSVVHSFQLVVYVLKRTPPVPEP